MQKPLRVALIGCGKICEKYVTCIAAHPGEARIAAVSDVDLRRAEEFAHRCGSTAHSSIQELVDREGAGIDLYIVLTPSGHHAAHVCELAESGASAILVEKPLALRLEDAERAIRTCDENNCQLFVVKQWRYNAAVQALRRAYERGRFGKISLLTSRLRWCRHQHYYDEARWRGTWEHDGGVLTNQACHAVDLLLWFGGEVDSVYSICTQHLASIEAEDTAVAVIRFESGALGALEATTAVRPRNLEGSFSLIGEWGAVELAGTSVNKVQTWSFEAPAPEDELCRRIGSVEADASEAHASYLREVFASVREGRRGGVSGREALESLRVIHALYQADQQNMPVEVRSNDFALSRLGRRAAAEPVAAR